MLRAQKYFVAILTINLCTVQHEKLTVLATRTLQLAALLPYTGSWPVGYGMSGAVPMAIDFINSDPSFAYIRKLGYRFNYTLVDCPCDEGPGMTSYAKLAMSDLPPAAFVGPACDNVCEPAGYMGAFLELVTITYGCVAPALTAMPYIQRTVAPYTQIGPFVLAFLQQYGWKRAGIVTGQDNVWQQTTDYLSGYLTGFNIDVTAYRFFEVSWVETEINLTTARLATMTVAMQNNRVFIVLMSSDDLQSFVYVVNRLGMLNGKYAYLTVSLTLDSSYWDAVDEQYNIDKSLVNGFFNLSPLYPSGDWTTQFLANVAARAVAPPELKDILSSTVVTPNQVDPHVYPLYDAFILYATAVNNSVAAGSDISDAPNLTNVYMADMYYWGSSGRTYETSQGDAQPLFSIANVRYGVFVEIASYSPAGTQFINTPIQWPGGGFVPVLGRPDCGWNNEYCSQSTVIIISVVVVVVALTALSGVLVAIYRYQRSVRHLMSSAWKLTYSELNFDVVNSSRSLEAARHSARLALGSEEAMVSTESLADDVGTRAAASSVSSSVQPAYYLGQLVAVKHIKKPYVSVTKPLVTEINQVRLLRHQNVVSFVGVCVEPNRLCVAMGYCAKGSLRDVLQSRHVTLDKIFTTSFTSDIVQGMAYLHASPIQYHGNLKSSNILLDSRWTCKISDFGLKELRAGEGGPIRGEPAYYYALLWTAPELLRMDEFSRQGSQKADIFSFSIILQEIVTRKSPYGRGYAKPKDIIDRLKGIEYPPYRPQVTMEEAGSSDMLELMMSCWDEEPSIRPTFEIIKESLKRITRGKQVNIVDQMIHMLERHSAHLEELVQDRTKQLTEEQKKTDELLSRMLPRSVADALKLGQTVDPENYASATVSFSDIVGFTAMAAKSSPLQVVQLLNDLYTCFDTAIEKFDAYKVETIGDAYMVASGVPVRNGNRHAGEIAMLALELLSEIRTFRIRHLADKQLQLRLGVHSGPVVAGVVGVKMPRYCLFGDTVNTASRMESSGLALRIHISPDTKKLLDQLGGYNLVERGPITMKGKGTITTYFLVGKEGFSKILPDPALAAPLSEHEFK